MTTPNDTTEGPSEEETVYNPSTDGGAVRVPLERPVVAPTPDMSGRDPDGPKTARFNPDDIPDADMAAAAGVDARPKVPASKDKTLQRFLGN